MQSSVSGMNIVQKENENQNAFAWKKVSLKVFADCTVIINKNSGNPSTLHLMSGLELNLDDFNINSLEFVEADIPYYYIAGW